MLPPSNAVLTPGRLQTVKEHKAKVLAKERELQNLSASLAQRETALTTTIAQKDSEIARLTKLVSQSEERTKRAIAVREEELCAAVMRREEEVRAAMAKREEEILDAVRKREEEINVAWQKREDQLRNDLQNAMEWVQTRKKELAEEAQKMESARTKLAKEREQIQQASKGSCLDNPLTVVWPELRHTLANRAEKTPLEDVKNLLAPFRRVAWEEQEEDDDHEATPRRPTASSTESPSATLQRCCSLETPVTAKPVEDKKQQPVPIPGSAMRGVILTATGEALKTPAPFAHTSSKANAALTNIIKNTPAVGLNFRKIFDFTESVSSDDENDDADAESVTGTMTTTSRSCASSVPELSSPTKEVTDRRRSRGDATSSSGSVPARAKITVRRQSSSKVKTTASSLPVPKSPQKPMMKRASHATETKARRPSTRTSGRPSIPTSASTPALFSGTQQSAAQNKKALLLPPTPHYDRSDEENLPSPFLRRVDRAKMTRVSAVGAVSKVGRRKSAHNLLRARAAVNAASNAQAQAAPSTKEQKSS